MVNSQREYQNLYLFIMEDKYIDELISNNLKRILDNLNISQNKLAEMIEVPPPLINQIMKQKKGMGKDLMVRICTALKIEPHEFYYKQEIPIITDEGEKDLLFTYRKAKELDPFVAEKIPEYGRFLLIETKRHEEKSIPKKTGRDKADVR